MSPVALLGLGPWFSLWRPTNARAHSQVAALSGIGVGHWGRRLAWPVGGCRSGGLAPQPSFGVLHQRSQPVAAPAPISSFRGSRGDCNMLFATIIQKRLSRITPSEASALRSGKSLKRILPNSPPSIAWRTNVYRSCLRSLCTSIPM